MNRTRVHDLRLRLYVNGCPEEGESIENQKNIGAHSVIGRFTYQGIQHKLLVRSNR